MCGVYNVPPSSLGTGNDVPPKPFEEGFELPPFLFDPAKQPVEPIGNARPDAFKPTNDPSPMLNRIDNPCDHNGNDRRDCKEWSRERPDRYGNCKKWSEHHPKRSNDDPANEYCKSCQNRHHNVHMLRHEISGFPKGI